MTLNIEVRKPGMRDAFAMLRNNIGKLNWFAKNNRPYQEKGLREFNHPLINAMINDRHLVTSETYRQFDDKYFDDYKRELYPVADYDNIIPAFNQLVPKIAQVGEKFQALHDSWGFKVFDKYYIDLDYYGFGGKYDSENGRVIVGLRGGMRPTENVAPLIIHEMIHLGIDDLIINPEKTNPPRIPQEEKERIVDNLCIYVLEGIAESKRMLLPDGTMSAYQPVAECASYMDEVVGKQPETNLVEAVEAFINNKKMATVRYINKQTNGR